MSRVEDTARILSPNWWNILSNFPSKGWVGASRRIYSEALKRNLDIKKATARTQPGGYFKHLAPAPAGLPSGLLLRRPDIRAAAAPMAVRRKEAATWPRFMSSF